MLQTTIINTFGYEIHHSIPSGVNGISSPRERYDYLRSPDKPPLQRKQGTSWLLGEKAAVCTYINTVYLLQTS